MKMKKIFILGGLLMSGALVSGCSDFLEVKKYGASTVWETQGAASCGSSAAVTT